MFLTGALRAVAPPAIKNDLWGVLCVSQCLFRYQKPVDCMFRPWQVPNNRKLVTTLIVWAHLFGYWTRDAVTSALLLHCRYSTLYRFLIHLFHLVNREIPWLMTHCCQQSWNMMPNNQSRRKKHCGSDLNDQIEQTIHIICQKSLREQPGAPPLMERLKVPSLKEA